MRVILIIILILGSLLNIKAQRFPFEFWHEGRIMLLEGDTLKGTIKYNLENDILQWLHQDKTVSTFTARKVIYFEIFDVSVDIYREFYALPFALGGDYKVPVFFEVLVEGRLTLLTRERVELRNVNPNPYFYYNNFNREVLVYTFYFLDLKGDIIEYTGNKNELLRYFGRHGDDVNRYMRQNKLKSDNKNHLIKILRYYNSLFTS